MDNKEDYFMNLKEQSNCVLNSANAVPVCEPQNKCITSDLANINYALNEIENIAELILSKIDGGKETNSTTPK